MTDPVTQVSDRRPAGLPVPARPEPPTLEAACRILMGAGRPSDDYHPAPGVYVVDAWLMHEGWPRDLICEAILRLERVAWFWRLGIRGMPWTYTADDVERLLSERPWEWPGRTAPSAQQLDLFASGGGDDVKEVLPP